MEVRDPDLHCRKIKMIYPRILFHRCKVCGYEFRCIAMWSWIDSWYPEGSGFRAYACTSCVHDLKELLPHIDGYKPREEIEHV